MQIILIRHGEAERQLTTDADRKLTAHGEAQAQQTAAWLVNHGFQLDGLFASPYVRAQQTAAFISQVTEVSLTTCDALRPDCAPQGALKWLEQLDLPDQAVVALVCHMPIVGRLASLLGEGDGAQAELFGLAQARVYELPALVAGTGREIAGFTPHD